MSRGLDAFLAWVDELARELEEREAVLRGVAARGLNPPKADDTPLTVRWACAKPTDPPLFMLDDGMYIVPKLAVDSGFNDLLSRWQKLR